MSKIVQQPPCPFWRAATIDQSAHDPNAPAPLDPNASASVAKGREMLAYHGGFGKVSSFLIAQLLPIAANKGLAGKIKGVLTQTWVPNHLSGGLLDKSLDTGILRGRKSGDEVVGRFSSEAFTAMFEGPHASDYQTADGRSVRGLSAKQLDAFVEANAKRVDANFIHKAMAHFEMKNLLLEHFGTDAKDGAGQPVRIIQREAAEAFFRHGVMPGPGLAKALAERHPACEGAKLAGGEASRPASAALDGAKSGCPFHGVKLPGRHD